MRLMKTPDAIYARLRDLVAPEDQRVLDDVLEAFYQDIAHSFTLAMTIHGVQRAVRHEVRHSVDDYASNHYFS
jgi:hypothetical protein